MGWGRDRETVHGQPGYSGIEGETAKSPHHAQTHNCYSNHIPVYFEVPYLLAQVD